jgi:hypothetical protein
VTDHGDQLREAFKTHEDRTPDPAVVYARVEELARTYRRRRRGAQAAGGAVLGAGLIAGVLTVPGLIGPPPQDGFPMVAPAAAPSSVAPAPPSEADLQRWSDAYYQAGYDYDDAVTLAKMWKRTDGDMGGIKAEAGRRLLAGETLPFAPTPNETEDTGEDVDDPNRRAFFDEGYVWEDAQRLAEIWNLDEPGEAKAEAGKRLLAGKRLPIEPKPANVAAALEGKRVNKFFAAGYDYDDAVKLADMWKLDSAYDAKVEGGKRLLGGDTLPIRP